MNIKLLALSIVFLISLLAKGQDKSLLKKHVRNEFKLLTSVDISYHSHDFLKIPVKYPIQDDLSFNRINELKDSLKITDNIFYLTSIGLLYNRLNRKFEARKFLNESLAKHLDSLNMSSKDDLFRILNEILTIYSGLNDQKVNKINDRIIKEYPKYIDAKIWKSAYLLGRREYQEIISYSDSLIKFHPENPSFYLIKTLALVYKELNSPQNSKSDYKTTDSPTKFQDNLEVLSPKLKTDFSYLDIAENKYKNNIEMEVATLSMMF